MYALYLEDWFRIFPREQIHVVQLETYSENKADYINQIYEFLGLGKHISIRKCTVTFLLKSFYDLNTTLYITLLPEKISSYPIIGNH